MEFSTDLGQSQFREAELCIVRPVVILAAVTTVLYEKHVVKESTIHIDYILPLDFFLPLHVQKEKAFFIYIMQDDIFNWYFKTNIFFYHQTHHYRTLIYKSSSEMDTSSDQKSH